MISTVLTSTGRALGPFAPGRPAPLFIAGLTVAPPILLAPMSGLTNLPLRTICEELGCGLTITEFLPAPALASGVRKEIDKLQPSRGGRPFGVQLFGRDPTQMERAARLAAGRGARLIDINMGCPARKVTKGAAGAALMKDELRARELVASALSGVSGRLPVTVKIRSGWDETRLNAPEFAAAMVEAGAAAVTVHGRTARQAFTGRSDLEIVARVKSSVPVPVIGNGDVVDLASLERMFEQTACDGVMIGRAALGNPWIFSAALGWWRGQAEQDLPGAAARLAMCRRHLDLYLELIEPERAVREMRKFACWYLRGFPGAQDLRRQLCQLGDPDAVRSLLDEARCSLPSAT